MVMVMIITMFVVMVCVHGDDHDVSSNTLVSDDLSRRLLSHSIVKERVRGSVGVLVGDDDAGHMTAADQHLNSRVSV